MDKIPTDCILNILDFCRYSKVKLFKRTYIGNLPRYARILDKTKKERFKKYEEYIKVSKLVGDPYNPYVPETLRNYITKEAGLLTRAYLDYSIGYGYQTNYASHHLKEMSLFRIAFDSAYGRCKGKSLYDFIRSSTSSYYSGCDILMSLVDHGTMVAIKRAHREIKDKGCKGYTTIKDKSGYDDQCMILKDLVDEDTMVTISKTLEKNIQLS